MQIRESVAVVTGANRGIGAEFVRQLLERGATKVYAGARDASTIAIDDPRVVPVTLDVTLVGAGVNPLNKKTTVGFEATGTIKRSEFGIGQYAPNVSDEVRIDITVEASKK